MLAKPIYLAAITIALVAISIGGYFINKTVSDSNITEFWNKSNNTNATTIDHSAWQAILDDYLIIEHPSGINRVDYEGLADDKVLLEEYIQSLSIIDPRTYSKKEQMSYWINLYNALTVLLITENYPVTSITELGETTIAFGPWDDPVTTIVEKNLTLNDIEHRILRPIWQDSRIHFAVNCASIGCPNLQPDVFTSENLEELLTQGAIEYLNHRRGVRFEGDKLVLSSLFDWYAKDFGNNTQEVLISLSQYASVDIKQKLSSYSSDITYEYDWGLNEDSGL